MPTTRASLIAAFAVTGLVAGAGVATNVTPQTAPASVQGPEQGPEPPIEDTVVIECGGYDEAGDVVVPEATRIGHAPVDDAGVPDIPDVCGGYTVDGTFIGDD